MATLFSAADRNLDPRQRAERLLGKEIFFLTHLSRAGNNRIYRVDTASASYALKLYPRENGVCARLRREYDAVTFLAASGAAASVPRACGIDTVAGFALYEWIDGTALTSHTMNDIDAAVAFIARLAEARSAPLAHALPAATEACPAAIVLFAQIATRLASLRAVSDDARLGSFLTCEFAPAFDELVTACRRAARRDGIDLERELPPEARTLSPSDFSFHNALRRTDDSVVFLDFEYFGWDDPVKLASDFLWHPAKQIRTEERRRFVEGVRAIFEPTDADIMRRLRAYFPLFGLKWCLIILNEFLVGGWSRRAFSGERRTWDDVKTEQLRKAHDLLADVRKAMLACPF